MATQQGWLLRVGDGAGTEVFTAISGQYELSEFDPMPYTISDRTDIAHARQSRFKKYEFDRQMDGQEFSITIDEDQSDPAQQRLTSQVGVNEGVNMQFEIEDGSIPRTETWTFNVLVMKKVFNPSGSQDSTARDQATYTLKINADEPTRVVA